MKHLLASLLVTAVSGDLAKMKQVMPDVIQIVRNETGSGRKTSKFPSAWLEDIDGYGCYCTFIDGEGFKSKGYGEPLDEIDEACRKLQDGYECGAIDSGGCLAYEVDYVPMSRGDINTCKANNNKKKCEQIACYVEALFVKTMAPNSKSNSGPKP